MDSTIKCPACRKENKSEECRRCHSDLTPLFVLHEAAFTRVELGKVALEEKRWVKAIDYASDSWRYKKTLEAAYIGFCAACASENVTHPLEAAYWYGWVKELS